MQTELRNDSSKLQQESNAEVNYTRCLGASSWHYEVLCEENQQVAITFCSFLTLCETKDDKKTSKLN